MSMTANVVPDRLEDKLGSLIDSSSASAGWRGIRNYPCHTKMFLGKCSAWFCAYWFSNLISCNRKIILTHFHHTNLHARSAFFWQISNFAKFTRKVSGNTGEGTRTTVFCPGWFPPIPPPRNGCKLRKGKKNYIIRSIRNKKIFS